MCGLKTRYRKFINVHVGFCVLLFLLHKMVQISCRESSTLANCHQDLWWPSVDPSAIQGCCRLNLYTHSLYKVIFNTLIVAVARFELLTVALLIPG